MATVIKTLDDVAVGLTALKELDPRLEQVIAKAGPVPLRRRDPSLENLMRIIVSQQVSVASAAAIWERFITAFDLSNPANITTVPDEALQAVGLSRPKIKTIRAVAHEAQENGLICEALVGVPANAVHERLTQIHGIGPWTAEIFTLFCLGDPDIFPVGDIALQQAVMDAFDLNERPKGDILDQIALQWSPWRGVAARLFWAYYAATRRKADALPV